MFVCSPACHIAREAFAEYVDFVEGWGMSSPLGVYALGAGYDKSRGRPLVRAVKNEMM
jgi:hypothetical protein